jgi:dihydrofolate synthase/folylpolyglutamate synthase
MTYQETIDFLFTRLPMFSRIGEAAYKKDLTNTLALCSILDDPHKKFKSIHIAGTNGKGSVSHMLAAIFQTAGYKTGLYTSPHLNDFRERIRINGDPIPEQYVIDFTEKIQTHIPNIEPSFFELTVAMAFSYFAEEQVDIAIIETGLGGRLDSTNVITPELSIITNIGWDHMNLLGNTKALIAGEKAGIIKQQVPVIIGESIDETRSIFTEHAKEKNSPIIFAEEEWSILNYNLHEKIKLEAQHYKGETHEILLDLTGIYQLKNILPILSACYHLKEKGWQITTTQIIKALAKVQLLTGLQGRWQIWQKHPVIVLDVGHNQDGIQQIIHQLSQTNYNQLHVVMGMVKDKEINEVLALMPKEATYYFTNAKIPRALPSAELQKQAMHHGLLSGSAYSNTKDALLYAKAAADKNDLILVCGSVFVVGEALEVLKESNS